MWLSFTEGALVVAVELCGTKLLSPMLGSTVYVWSFMLSITLLALAAGYYTGGYISEKISNPKAGPLLLLIASIFAVVMPFISEKVFVYFGEWTFIPLLAAECIAVLFVPLFILGCISPVLIRLLSEQSGKLAASRIFTISTLGGVLAGFILSFVSIEKIGVDYSLLLFCSISFFVASVSMIRDVMPLMAVYIGLATMIYFIPDAGSSARYEVLYHRNGILGDIRVVRFAPYDTAVSKTPATWVFVNNISQTMYDPGAKEKYFTYNYRIRSLMEPFPVNTKLLLCGMGGGSMINILEDKNLKIQVCELDERMPEIARKYFGLKDTIAITIDDARHYIRTSEETYDAVIMDIFRGEETPNHVLSIEGLNDLKKIIHDSSLVIINSHGYLKGKRGEGNRAIYKTLTAAGFHVTAEYTDASEEKSNLLFICRLKSQVESSSSIAPSEFQTDEPVLSDKLPRLEKLNRQAALRWRSEAKMLLFSETRVE